MSAPRRSERLAAKPSVQYVPVKMDTAERRVLKEMAEFDDPVYQTEFTCVVHIDTSTVTVKHINGRTYKITRSKEILNEPPVIVDLESGDVVGAECGADNWSPYFTSVRWFMMLLAE
jgi:hypothetical protein